MNNRAILFGIPAEKDINEIVDVDADQEEDSSEEIISTKEAERQLKKHKAIIH